MNIGLHVNYPNSCQILIKLWFSWKILEKNVQISTLMNIRPVEAYLFHVHRRTDVQTDMTNLVVAYRNFLKVLKKVTKFWHLFLSLRKVFSRPGKKEQSKVLKMGYAGFPQWCCWLLQCPAALDGVYVNWWTGSNVSEESGICLQGRQFGLTGRYRRHRIYSTLMSFLRCKTWVDIIIDIK